MTKTATEMLTFDGVVLVHLIIQSPLRNKIDLKKKVTEILIVVFKPVKALVMI